jgi:hypothetical protein
MSDEQPFSSSPFADAVARRGEAMRGATNRGHARVAHIRRCRAAGPPSESDIQRMVSEYLAQGGQIQVCKAAYAVPVHNGTGRADVRS